MGKVDDYLILAFDAAAERQTLGDTVFLPMLVQLKNVTWNPSPGIPDYSELARFGDLLVCIGTLRTVNFFE